jgi:hypothetical protein
MWLSSIITPLFKYNYHLELKFDGNRVVQTEISATGYITS